MAPRLNTRTKKLCILLLVRGADKTSLPALHSVILQRAPTPHMHSLLHAEQTGRHQTWPAQDTEARKVVEPGAKRHVPKQS